MDGLKQRLRASTLLETLVALVIIAFSFGAGLMVYGRTASSFYANDRLEAMALVDSLLYQMKVDDFYFDQEGEANQYNYKVAVEEYPESDRLSDVRISISTLTGQTIYQSSQVIKRDED